MKVTSNRTRGELRRWLAEHLAGRRMLFVTLTSPMAVPQSAFSAAIPKLVHRMKRRVLGRSNEDKDLALVGVMEHSYKDGFHAHLLLEDPYSLATAKAFPSRASVEELIKEEWGSLGIGGRQCAQDVQPVYDLDGAISYVLKTAGEGGNFDQVDLNNLCLPERSAT